MKATFFTYRYVEYRLGLFLSQLGHSAAIQSNDKATMPTENTSLIEKALKPTKRQ